MIHPAYNLFLAVYLAHVLTDFVFQTGRLVSKKHRGEWRGYLVHGATHYIAVLAIVAIADPHRFLTLYFQVMAVSLSVVHLIVDWAKLSVTKSRLMPDNALAFVLDQTVHLATVIGAVLLLVRPPLQMFASYLMRIRLLQETILLLLVVYVFVIFGGGYFIRVLIGPLWEKSPAKRPRSTRK